MAPEVWHEHVTKIMGISLSFSEFRAAWNRALDPKTILNEEFFARLSSRSRLALLSNTDPIHAEHLENCFPFVRQFPVRIYSCDIGSRKPSPAIYETALNSLGIAAREAVYIDDIGEFVDAARRLGLDAIRFDSPAQLEMELSKRGVVA